LEYAYVLVDSWELDRGREILEHSISRRRASDDSGLTTQLETLARVELRAGNLDRAAELAQEAAEVAAQGGRIHDEIVALFGLGRVEALRGNVNEARDLCARSLRLAEQSGGRVRGARLTIGYLESALENYEAAWSYLDPATTGTPPTGRPLLQIAESIEVLVALGRTGAARRLFEPFDERAQVLRRDSGMALAAHCRSLILAQEGDLGGAEEAATQAVTLTEANDWPLELGRALLALGAVQRRGQRKREARATLDRAVAVFEELGAKIWLERARHELRRIGGRSVPAGHELSETEMRIAELVAAGQTNNEVAQALHLSRKTVEWNLSKIYRKLEVRSRTELAARFPGD
jgi:DNA-binding CsgD family transcriptional regulator